MSSPKITIKEVAKRAGVSIATVSRFLNNSPLKEENRRKVEEAVRELDYHPALYARRLAGGKLDSFGLIIPGYEGIFYTFYALEIIRELAVALTEGGIDLHLNIFWDKDNFRTSLVDGVIMADIIGNEEQFKRLIKEGIPMVVMNKDVEAYGVSCITIDNFKGAYEATDFLIQHGHKRIAHLAGDLRVQSAKDRLEGYKSALTKQGIEVKKEYIKTTNFSPRESWERLEELFSQKDVPTAIFCCSDEVASGVLNFAEEKRIKIPDELSVIGFDDNPNCLFGNLMLTTVRQPLKDMVSQAVQILKESVKGQKPPQKVVLDTKLIIRDTVGFV